MTSGTKSDALNVTRLYSGNDSDIMDMTTCVGGLVAKDSTVEPDSPVLSPTLEQENNINRRGYDAYLVDAHNKSVLCMEEPGDGDASEPTSPSTSFNATYPTAAGSAVNKTVLLGDDMESTMCLPLHMSVATVDSDSDNMETTQCLSLLMSAKTNDDVEMTQCLEADVSTNIKPSCRWPFGKRQDGRREKVALCDSSATSESRGVTDTGPFVGIDVDDVYEKMDTAALLEELTEKPAQKRAVYSPPRQTYDSLECCLPSDFCASVTNNSITSASVTGVLASENAVDIRPSFVSDQECECPANGITDKGEVKTAEKRSHLSKSPVRSVDAVEIEPVKTNNSCILVSSEISVVKSISSGVKQHGPMSGSFIAATASEADDSQRCVASNSWLSDVSITYPMLSETTLPITAIASSVPAVIRQVDSYRSWLEKSLSEDAERRHSWMAEEPVKVTDMHASVVRPAALCSSTVASSVPDAVNQVKSYRSWLEKSLNEDVEHRLSQLVEEPVNYMSASCARPACFGADAVESIFARKECNDEVSANSLAAVENVSMTAAESGQLTVPYSRILSQDTECSALPSTAVMELSGFTASESCSEIVASKAETEPQKSLNVSVSTAIAGQNIVTDGSILSQTTESTVLPCVSDAELSEIELPGSYNQIISSKTESQSLNASAVAADSTQKVITDGSILSQTAACEMLPSVKDADLLGIRTASSCSQLISSRAETTPQQSLSDTTATMVSGQKIVTDSSILSQTAECEVLPSIPDLSTVRPLLSCNQMTSSQTETEAQNLLKRPVPRVAQPADDLLAHMKLANSMSSQFRKGSITADAHHSFRTGNFAAKMKSGFAFGACDKPFASSFYRHSSASAIQQNIPDLDRTKELTRAVDITGLACPQLDVYGDRSRIDISAQRVEMTDSLPSELVSFSLTENLDVTRQNKMHLEAIRNVKSPGCESELTSYCGNDGECDDMETSANRIREPPSSVKSSLQSGINFTIPVTTVASESSIYHLPAAFVTTTDAFPVTSSVSESSISHLSTTSLTAVDALPCTASASEPAVFHLPTTTISTTNSVPSLLGESSQLEITKYVRNLSLAAESTGSHRDSMAVDMETSATHCPTKLPSIAVAAKCSSESSDRNLSLPSTGDSQSSVFYPTESEMKPRHAHVQTEDVGPTSTSSNKVRAK